MAFIFHLNDLWKEPPVVEYKKIWGKDGNSFFLFPWLDLASECDENCYKYLDIDYEIRIQREIEKKPGCEFEYLIMMTQTSIFLK